MGLGHYLFSFSGRINRAKQWAILLLIIVFEILFGMVIAATIGFATILDVVRQKVPLGTVLGSSQARMAGVALLALYLVFLYIELAVRTKRLHDRGKSAWWLLVFSVAPVALNIPRFMGMWDRLQHFGAILNQAQHGQHVVMMESPLALLLGGAGSIISLWAFVELFCLRGTVGDNRYGPDPLAGR
ncbi:MAG TPA: DUF805 domain-containing protein [Rhizomicrobium sp.]|jgi:uncharacterized membrane protein YhaH (DUF805 family)|nr:DUF805 domain-containing protein [Rhizomicrobium sp.]